MPVRQEQRRKTRPARPGPWPLITVVVPVRNEAAFIRATLGQLLDQDYPADRFEIIVADGQSTDATAAIVRELARSFPNLRLLPNPKRWSSAGRNVGVRAARGEFVLIVDGHCDLANRRYLRDLASAFARSGADCVGRPQPLDVTGASTLQKAIAAARSSRLGHHPESFIYSSKEQFVRPQSVAVAYRRELFDRLGFFDEQFDACEDVEFNHRLDRAGLRCFFTPRVRAHYYPRSSLSGLFRQMVRYGRGRVRLCRKHPDTFTLAGFMPGLFLLGLVLGPLAAWLSPWLAAFYFGVLALYGLAVGWASVAAALRARNLRILPWLPAVFPTIHLGAGFGILRELVPGGKRRPAGSEAVETVENKITHPAILRFPTLFSPGAPVNALTVDVEDYYHVSAFEKCVDRECWGEFESRVVGSTRTILETLERAEVRGTFFVLGWVAQRHPELVRAIHRVGHEIGCHSYWHRLVYRQTPDEFRADLRRARDVLQDITGQPVRAFRAPSFSITRRSLWALDVLIDEGFAVDSSIYPTVHDRYGIAGAPCRPHYLARPGGGLWEFPLPVMRRLGYPLPVGGGGYLRLYPYAVTRSALRTINREGRPFVVYLHPWEVDPDQPRLNPGRLRAFRHYVNLHRTRPRLRKLLRDFRFGTVSQVLENLQSRGELRRGKDTA
jgi:succinoglycan biosynthesis protein ExoA